MLTVVRAPGHPLRQLPETSLMREPGLTVECREDARHECQLGGVLLQMMDEAEIGLADRVRPGAETEWAVEFLTAPECSTAETVAIAERVDSRRANIELSQDRVEIRRHDRVLPAR